jgi:ABC-type glycerol-3-phosphate transport system substrate-binding protein
MRFLQRLTVLLFMIFGAVAVPLANTHAQNNPVTITLAISNLSDSVFGPQLINDFESAHPGIKISIVKANTTIPAAALDLDRHFQAVQQFARSADVLYVSNGNVTGGDTTSLSVEATRAGYFLDLKPLVGDDKTLNPDDFFPAIWQSYQWDGGVWAMPFAADPYILTYDPAAFDAAGLSYPNDKWTLDDLSNAMRKLVVKDSSGKTTAAALDIYGGALPYLFRGLLANSLLDTSAIPNIPKFDTPEVNTLFQNWLKLDQEGLISAEFGKAPLTFAPAIIAVTRPSGAAKQGAALLPGGKAPLNVQGFAVSSGTQHPAEAYALAAWLTTRADVANNALATLPARQSLLGVQGDKPAAFTLNITPEMQAVITQAAANTIPLSEMRYTDYLASAYNNIKTSNTDIQIALRTAEDQALKNQQAAADRKNNLTVVVATPIPSGNQTAGKIALKVGIVGFGLPNEDLWNKFNADFAASDPQVEKVALEQYLDATSLNQLGPALQKFDCVYTSGAGISPAQLPHLLNLDPFLNADPTFDKADMLNGTLAQVTLDNKIWMLPSDIAPTVLKYESDRFQKDGVPEPTNGWTIEQFADALKTFKDDGGDQPGFVPLNTFGAYLFQLIAAYGGNPIDYRTAPPTINFTDPATVEAVQQVINLAKDGAFKYRPLFSTRLDISFGASSSTIRQDILTAFVLPIPKAPDTEQTKVTLFPKGTKYNAVTYNLGGFYISATAQSPEACYRYISKAARMPVLFTAMPARRSLLNDATLASTQSPDTIALYKQIAAQLDDPNTLIFPGVSIVSDRLNIQLELEFFEAFDKAMLTKTDLGEALTEAEGKAKTFQGCATALPPLGVNADEQRTYLNGFVDCAVKSDPAMGPLYAGLKIK